MDEEQGLASPLAGGLRGIRRTVSSSIFGGGRAPVQAQPDPQTTNLLQQNSLALNNVSAQLTNINAQVAGLSGSLASIKENWVDPFGDMRQELVFIGQDVDQEAVTSELNNCLLSESEVLKDQSPIFSAKGK